MTVLSMLSAYTITLLQAGSVGLSWFTPLQTWSRAQAERRQRGQREKRRARARGRKKVLKKAEREREREREREGEFSEKTNFGGTSIERITPLQSPMTLGAHVARGSDNPLMP